MVTLQISSRYKEGWGKDTLSQVYFFDVTVEALANQIWMSNNSIKGLKNGNMVTKLSLRADDTTAFIHDESSAIILLSLLENLAQNKNRRAVARIMKR